MLDPTTALAFERATSTPLSAPALQYGDLYVLFSDLAPMQDRGAHQVDAWLPVCPPAYNTQKRAAE